MKDMRQGGDVMKKLLITLAAMASPIVLSAAPAMASGVSGPAFYVDGSLYRTVATPTDLSGTGAPADSFDIIWNFRGVQRNVAEAAPGQVGFNGGRWIVHGLAFSNYTAAVNTYDTNGSGDFDSDEEVRAALTGGAATDTGILRMFVCTVVPLPHNG
jgi:hypothetical protein